MQKLFTILSLFSLSFFTYGAKYQASDSSLLKGETTEIQLENGMRLKELENLYFSMLHKADKLTSELNTIKNKLPQSKLCFLLGDFNADYRRTTQFFARYRAFLFNASLWENLGVKKRDVLNQHRKTVNEIMVFAKKDVYVDTWNSCLLNENISVKRKSDLIDMLKVYSTEMKKGLKIFPLFV